MKRVSLFLLFVMSNSFAKHGIDELFSAIKKASQKAQEQNLNDVKEILAEQPPITIDRPHPEARFFKAIPPILYALDLAVQNGNVSSGPFVLLLEKCDPTTKVMGNCTLIDAAQAVVRNAAPEKKENAQRALFEIQLFYTRKNAKQESGRPLSSPF